MMALGALLQPCNPHPTARHRRDGISAVVWCTAIIVALLSLAGCFVSGESIVGPESPQFAEVCADSVATDSVPCLNNTATLGLEVSYHRYPWER